MHDPSANAPIHILLVEDNPGDAELIREALRETSQIQFVVTVAEQFSEAVERTLTSRFDLILLDLSLPDSHGLYTVVRACERMPDVPIVVLTGSNDETLGMEAVQAGAQDYLVKGQVANDHLARALHFALARHALQEGIRATSLRDELTGLNNRRGFLTLAQQQMKVAERTGGEFFLLYLDLDKFKQINDTLGHPTGDCALIDTADILRKTFRNSDVIARLGGDEFVVAVLEAGADRVENLTARLMEIMADHNVQADRPYHLEMSIGSVQYRHRLTTTIEDLLADADAAMYVQKRLKISELSPVSL